MEWQDHQLVLISALEHWSYCQRQCALRHLDRTDDENIFTMRGQRVHRLVHEGSLGTEGGVPVVRGMPLWSDRLGLTGKADLIEFHEGTPFPVEYKAGRRRFWVHEALQLCAQAICLEEMFGRPVPAGAIYYYGSRARRTVVFDDGLRLLVEEATTAVRAMLAGTQLPPAPNDERCPDCALFEACLPSVTANPARIRGFQGALFRCDDD